MEINCKCGNLVLEGNIKQIEKFGGKIRDIFGAKKNPTIDEETNQQKGYMFFSATEGWKLFPSFEEMKPQGELHTKHKHIKDWTAICSDCQKRGQSNSNNNSKEED